MNNDYKEDTTCDMCSRECGTVHKAAITGTYLCIDCLHKVYGRHADLRYCEDCGEVFARDLMRRNHLCYSCTIKSTTKGSYKRNYTCKICGDKLTTNCLRVEGKNTAICDDCIDSGVKFSYCKICKEFHKLSDMAAGLNKVCKKCKKDKGVGECAVCGRTNVLDNNKLCPICTNTHAPCKKCGCLSLKAEVNLTFKDYMGKTREGCKTCANTDGESFQVCGGCGVMSTTVVNSFCSDCRHERGIRYMHNWRYRPPVFIEYGVDDFHFGIENEFSVDESVASRDKVIASLSKMFHERVAYIQHDGSVHNGGELVTHPMTFSQIKQDKQGLSKAFNVDGVIPHHSTGMHIHISKSAFTTVSLYKFMKFISDHKEFIELVAERKSGGGRSAWSFEDKSMLKGKAISKRSGDKYVDVNLTHPKSVEVRIFKGATKFEQLLKNVEFCHALTTFSKFCGISTPSMKQFLGYIKDNSDKYGNLLSFLSNLDEKVNMAHTEFERGDRVVLETWSRTQARFGMSHDVLGEIGTVDRIFDTHVIVDFPSFGGFCAHPDDLVCMDHKPAKIIKDNELVKTIKSVLLGGE